jgi:phenylacetic acid degradation operon negative regulatory protein
VTTAVVLDVRPLTARSAILSMLLGAHPPSAAGSEIVSWGLSIGISEPATRVALSRMVAAGDLERSAGAYALAPRLVERQVRQDAALEQPQKDWDGRWIVAVTTAVGNDAATRANLRQHMLAARFGELREGVWMRPNNLDWQVPPGVEVMIAEVEGSAASFVARLFDVDGWGARATALLAALDSGADLKDRLAIAAAVVRHLTLDPLLPSAVLPADWPASALREGYRTFRAGLLAARGSTGPQRRSP